jgi:hypothetical protein
MTLFLHNIDDIDSEQIIISPNYLLETLTADPGNGIKVMRMGYDIM